MKQEDIEMQLWEYIDGSCNEADRQRISMLIAADPVWRDCYNEIAAFNSGIAGSIEAEQPSMRFTKNVMEAVAAAHIAPATRRYINPLIIKGIAAFFLLSILSMLGYAIATTKWATSATTYSLPKINMSNLFSGTSLNVVIGINIVLALVLLDVALRKKQAQQR